MNFNPKLLLSVGKVPFLIGPPPALGYFSFLFKWEENKYFLPYAYSFIYESDLLNMNFIEKNHFILLFL